MRTDDGGSSWNLTSVLDADDGFGADDVKFIDEAHGWAPYAFGVFRSSDGGVSWSRQPISHSREGSRSLGATYFLSALDAWASESPSENLLHSTDGGLTWQEVPFPAPLIPGSPIEGEKSYVSDIFFTDGARGWVVTSPIGGIYRTTDGGATWSAGNIPLDNLSIWSTSFPNSLEGWASGSKCTTPLGPDDKCEGVLLHTTDGGANWTVVDSPAEEKVFEFVKFLDSTAGWLIGHEKVYRTTDGGHTWDLRLTLPEPRPLKDS